MKIPTISINLLRQCLTLTIFFLLFFAANIPTAFADVDIFSGEEFSNPNNITNQGGALLHELLDFRATRENTQIRRSIYGDNETWYRLDREGGSPAYFRCTTNRGVVYVPGQKCRMDNEGGRSIESRLRESGFEPEPEPLLNRISDQLGTSAMEILQSIVLFFLQLSMWALGLAGTLFEFSLRWMVLEMSTFVGRGGMISIAVVSAWTAIRDIANIAFIGGLVWASIAMILNIAEAKAGQLIVKILVAAVLVNFSFFFAGIIIDASNFISGEIYEAGIARSAENAVAPPLNVTSGSETQSVSLSGIAALFMHETKLSSILSHDALAASDPTLSMFLTAVLGIGLFSVTVYVFLVATFLLISRFIVLTILLITSPIGILRWTGLPFVSTLGKDWWDALISQSLFAPIFLLFVGIAFTILSPLSDILGQGSFGQLATGNVDGGFSGSDERPSGPIAILSLFALAIGFMWASLVIARNMSQQAKSFNPVYGGVKRLRDWTLSGTGTLARFAGKTTARGVGMTAGALTGNADIGKNTERFTGKLFNTATLPLNMVAQKASKDIEADKWFKPGGAGDLGEAYKYGEKKLPNPLKKDSYDFDSKELQGLRRKVRMIPDDQVLVEEFDKQKNRVDRENFFFASSDAQQEVLKKHMSKTKSEDIDTTTSGTTDSTATTPPVPPTSNQTFDAGLTDLGELRGALHKIEQAGTKEAQEAARANLLELRDQKREMLENKKLITALDSYEYQTLKDSMDASNRDTATMETLRYEDIANHIQKGDEAGIKAELKKMNAEEIPSTITENELVVKVKKEMETSPAGVVREGGPSEQPTKKRRARRRPSREKDEDDTDN